MKKLGRDASVKEIEKKRGGEGGEGRTGEEENSLTFSKAGQEELSNRAGREVHISRPLSPPPGAHAWL